MIWPTNYRRGGGLRISVVVVRPDVSPDVDTERADFISQAAARDPEEFRGL